MNRRGKRLAFTAAAMGLAVILGLGILHWDAIRDHVEAWRFQRARTTETIVPDPELRATRAMPPGHPCTLTRPIHETEWSYNYAPQTVFQFLANYSGFQVIHASGESWTLVSNIALSTPLEDLTPDTVKIMLAANGWRVLEQRFPSRACVMVRASPQPPPQTPSWQFTRTTRRRRSTARRTARAGW
jgi:hypothetical protein